MKNQLDKEFLNEEYFTIQESINKYDEHLLKIKSWSVTLSLAGIVTGFVKCIDSVFLVAAISSLLFWIIDCLYKSFQNAFYYRAKKIEDYMSGKMDENDVNKFSSPDILGAWSAGYKSLNKLKIFIWPQVALPHLPVLILGVILWTVYHYFLKLS